MIFDAATETHLDLLYPGYSERLRAAMDTMFMVSGRELRITEAVRSFKRQEILYAQGRTATGPDIAPERPLGRTVTNARPGISVHHYGIAADVAFRGMDPYLRAEPPQEQERVWNMWGRCVADSDLTWGAGPTWGGSPDRPHSECRYGISVDELFSLLQQDGINAVWSHLDLARKVPVGYRWSTRALFDPRT